MLKPWLLSIYNQHLYITYLKKKKRFGYGVGNVRTAAPKVPL